MKITVCLPSRGRPWKLINSVMRLKYLASGNHQITYAIGVDNDDPDTVRACSILGEHVRAFVLKRRGSLGQIVNTLAENNPADVYISYADDVEMREPGWDQHVADAVTEHPDWVMWFKGQVHVDGKLVNENPYAVVPEAWRKAAGYIFTDYFPYWHDDGWLQQLWHFAAGTRKWMVIDVEVHDDDKGKTHRLHDFQEWQDFYYSPECDAKRQSEAARIAKELGWPAVENPAQYRLERPPMFTQWQLDNRTVGGERTPEYLQALERIRRGGDSASAV